MTATTAHLAALARALGGYPSPAICREHLIPMRALSPTAVRSGLDSTPPPHAVEAAPFNTVIVGLTRGLFAVIDAAPPSPARVDRSALFDLIESSGIS